MSKARKPVSSVPPIKTWDSLDEYIDSNPGTEQMWRTLRYGHETNTGHEWQGKLYLSPDHIVYFERECC